IALAPSAWASVVSLTLNPTSVFGTDSSTGTVTLNVVFPPQSRTVTLMSSNPNVASVPASVTVGIGQVTRTFTVTTFPGPTSTDGPITAQQGGTSRQALIPVRPPSLSSVTFSPNPVVGGQNTIATITTNRPVPSNWFCSIEGPFPPI